MPQNRPQFALGRLKTGEMNKSEAAYAADLDLQKHAGMILWWKFEGIKLRLADNTFYTCDFAVMMADGTMEMREVKGFFEEKAKIKIKVAASLYPFKFVVVRKKSRSDGGGWSTQEYG